MSGRSASGRPDRFRNWPSVQSALRSSCTERCPGGNDHAVNGNIQQRTEHLTVHLIAAAGGCTVRGRFPHGGRGHIKPLLGPFQCRGRMGVETAQGVAPRALQVKCQISGEAAHEGQDIDGCEFAGGLVPRLSHTGMAFISPAPSHQPPDPSPPTLDQRCRKGPSQRGQKAEIILYFQRITRFGIPNLRDEASLYYRKIRRFHAI